jgi:hypothetical protein
MPLNKKVANRLKLLDKHAVSIVLELFYVFDIIGTSRYIIRCHRHQHCASKDLNELKTGLRGGFRQKAKCMRRAATLKVFSAAALQSVSA